MKDADFFNRQFRLNDITRWRALNYVMGYEIHHSNQSEHMCEICGKLAGKYPKGFLWTGWHFKCFCYITPILLEYDELKNDIRSQLKSNIEGIEYIQEPQEAIQFLPVQFIIWYNEYIHQIDTKNPPDFITDNKDLIYKSIEHY